MAEVEPAVAPEVDEEDLEDGEIESDEEDDSKPAEEAVKEVSKPLPAAAITTTTTTSPSRTSHKPTDKPIVEPSPPKKARGKGGVIADDEEDFATNLERQLAQALGKAASPSPVAANEDTKRSKEDRQAKGKKRKRRHRNESPPERDIDRDKGRGKKKSKGDGGGESERASGPAEDDVDDFEMLNVRGGSPPAVGSTFQPPSDGNESDRSYSSYDSYDSADYHRGRRQQRRRNREHSSRRERNRRGGGAEKEHEKRGRGGREGNSGGRHHRDNGNDSEREPARDEYKNHPRKMELCKFYLMECCAKREKCIYMHQDFPCKYYYTQSECTQKDCKFSHGKPLTDALRAILMKHLETAPKEILGDFPRLGRELANQKIRSRHKELCAKFNIPDETPPLPQPSSAAQSQQQHHPVHSNGGEQQQQQKAGVALHIPPLNEIYSKPPPPLRAKMDDNRGGGRGHNFDKGRKSRWTESMRGEGQMTGANAVPVANFSKGAGPPVSQQLASSGSGAESSSSSTAPAKGVVNLRTLTNVLTQEQIEKLAAIGIETLGLSIGQLSEIQLNAIKTENARTGGGNLEEGKVGEKVNEGEGEKLSIPPSTVTAEMLRPPVLVADTDMRIVPTVNQDVDMRYLGPPPVVVVTTAAATVIPHMTPKISEIASPDAAEDRMEPNAVIDYSQYLREANLVAEPKVEEKESHEELSKRNERKLIESSRPVQDEESSSDDDDDDEEKLKIVNDEDEEEDREREREEEKVAKSDEDEEEEKKNEPPAIPSVSYWPLNLASLTTLNKIDLSSSVTQMMNAEKGEQQQPQSSLPKAEGFVSLYGRPEELQAENRMDEEANRDSDSDSMRTNLDPRDPRNRDPRNLREPPKSPPMPRQSQPQVAIRPSMYDCSEGEDSGGGSSPPQKPDQDMRLGAFYGESGDVDLRLPFKPMQNYVPATEIDGSISSHLPMVYKVFEWDVPKPNFKDIKRRMSVENSQDPRLKRIFGVDEGQGKEIERLAFEENERHTLPNVDPRTASDPRMDPRRRKEVTIQSPGGGSGVQQPVGGLDIQIVLQKSAWYTDLGSKNKIFVNQQLAGLTSELKRYHEEVSQNGPMIFDVTKVYEQSPMLANVLQQLCVRVDDHGAIQPMNALALGMPMQAMGGGSEGGMMMPELAAMIQQQNINNPAMSNMFNNMNPAAQLLAMQMQQQQQQMGNPGIRPGLLGIAPNVGFSGPPQQFDDYGGGGGGGQMQAQVGGGNVPGGEGNFMMGNYNDNMGGGNGGGDRGFFQQQQQQSQPNSRMMMNNNRGNFRNNNRNDRWMHNNNRGGNDGRRHNNMRRD